MIIRRSRRNRNSLKNLLKGKKEKFIDDYTTSRFYNHPYKTRSKSFKEVNSANKKVENLADRSSDTSIIFLGLFHKIPPIITLDDSSDEQDEKVMEHLETWITPKNQEVNINLSGKWSAKMKNVRSHSCLM